MCKTLDSILVITSEYTINIGSWLKIVHFADSAQNSCAFNDTR